MRVQGIHAWPMQMALNRAGRFKSGSDPQENPAARQARVLDNLSYASHLLLVGMAGVDPAYLSYGSGTWRDPIGPIRREPEREEPAKPHRRERKN